MTAETKRTRTHPPNATEIKRLIDLREVVRETVELRPSGRNFSGRCPFHDDQRASLSVYLKGEYWKWRCHGPCDKGGSVIDWVMATDGVDVVQAIETLSHRCNGSTTSPTARIPKEGTANTRREIVKVYDYRDESDDLLFQSVRYEPKDFSQRQPDGKGGWSWNLKGVRRVLYRLPELLAADPSTPVFVVEGEKDVDAIVTLGGVATTNPMGAEVWNDEYSPSLVGRRVIIIPDNDKSGIDHAHNVARSVTPFARSVKVVNVPGLLIAGDVSDYLNSGSTLDDLLELAKGASLWSEQAESPPADADDIDSPEQDSPQQTQRDLLVALAADAELFVSDVGDHFARVEIDQHFEIWPIDSRQFRWWLTREYRDRFRSTPGRNSISEAVDSINADAFLDGERHDLANRVAEHRGSFWYDLGDECWRAIRTTATCWEIVDRPPILFRRYKHQKSQVLPVHGGDATRLFRHIPLEGDDRLLLLVYLISVLIPGIPHPILCLHGEKGSGKSVASRIVRRLIDPSALESSGLPRVHNELVQKLNHNYLPCFDNVDGLTSDASDTLCRASTGEGFSKRKLFSDEEDVILNYRRCVVMNGVNVAPQKPDLLDRSILIELAPIDGGSRRTESEIYAAFERDRPNILGGMLDALQEAMKLRPSTTPGNLSRMADFETWGCAIADALGFGSAEFRRVYSASRRRLTDESLSGHPVGACIVEFMNERDDFSGTPSELFGALEPVAVQLHVQSDKRFPKAANVLTKRLKEVVGDLRDAGISVEIGKSGRRWVSIQRSSVNTVQAAQPPEDSVNGN